MQHVAHIVALLKNQIAALGFGATKSCARWIRYNRSLAALGGSLWPKTNRKRSLVATSSASLLDQLWWRESVAPTRLLPVQRAALAAEQRARLPQVNRVERLQRTARPKQAVPLPP